MFASLFQRRERSEYLPFPGLANVSDSSYSHQLESGGLLLQGCAEAHSNHSASPKADMGISRKNRQAVHIVSGQAKLHFP
jgi:hypothetical protein